MYQTLWIDISSGMERTLLDLVVTKVREFRKKEELIHAEVGLVFEEFDIFAIFELDDNELLLDFVLKEIATIEGVTEIRIGQLRKLSSPIRPLITIGDSGDGEGDAAAGGARNAFNLGESYFLIYLDALPQQYPAIMEGLDKMGDPNIRFYGYCLDSYEEDLVVCLAMEGFEQARYHIVDTLRNIKGMRDTRTYMVNNVVFL